MNEAKAVFGPADPPSEFDDPANFPFFEEMAASAERGDPEHLQALGELVRRFEAKGRRIIPGENPGDPPRAEYIDAKR